MASVRGRFSNTTIQRTFALAAIALGAHVALAAEPNPHQPAPEQQTVVPAARPQPTDLHPRPLGTPRLVNPAPGVSGAPALAPPGAAATLWDNPAIRTGGSLLLVLVLIVGLAAITRKVAGKSGTLAAALGPGGRQPAGLLEVLGRYPLSRGQTLILLKVDQRILLLAQTTSRLRAGAGGGGALATLCEITDAEEVASILVKAGDHEGTGATAKFSALLHAFDRSHASAEPDHTELNLRSIQQTDSGDRSELWDEQAAPPMVHKFPRAPAPRAAHAVHAVPSRVTDAYAQSGAPTHTSGPESFSSIRERLHALRGEAHR